MRELACPKTTELSEISKADASNEAGFDDVLGQTHLPCAQTTNNRTAYREVAIMATKIDAKAPHIVVRHLSAISAHETEQAKLRREDFRLIVALS
ncbi:hypothetical protein ACWKW9_22675, partial [Rhizobium daejeonense]